MAKQHVEIGDSGEVAKNKINANADELYQKVEELGNQADTKVKVSATDDEASYLANKILTPNKTLSIGTAGAGGAAQTLQVDVHVSILARLVKMWDRTLTYRGTTYPGKATPPAPSIKDCYLVLESGVCFGVTGCTGGDFLYYTSSPAGWNKVTPNSDISAATAKVMAMWNEGWVYKGKALYTTNPGVPTAKVFYFNTIESVARIYSNFGNESVAANEFCIFKYDLVEDEWIKESIFSLPAGSTNLNEYMKKASNLSDLTNVVSARANLGVYSKAEIDFKTQQLFLQEQQDFGDLTGEMQDLQFSLSTALANEALARGQADTALSNRIGLLENQSGASKKIVIEAFLLSNGAVFEVGTSVTEVYFEFRTNNAFGTFTSMVLREIREDVIVQEFDLLPYAQQNPSNNHGNINIEYEPPIPGNTRFDLIISDSSSTASKSANIYFNYKWFFGTEAPEDNNIASGDLSALLDSLSGKSTLNLKMNGLSQCLCFCCHQSFSFRIWLGGLEVNAFTETEFDYELPDQSTATYKLFKSDFAYNDESIDVKLFKYQ